MSAAAARDRLSELQVEQVFGLLLVGGLVVAVVHVLWLLATGDLPPGRFARYLGQGIVDGLIFGLAAIGLSMTYSILRFANFSHGDLLTAGAFSGWSAAYVVGGLGVGSVGNLLLLNVRGTTSSGALGMTVLGQPLAILVGIVVAAGMTIAIALAFDRLVYRRMRRAGGIALLIASVGVAFVLRYLIAFVYTSSQRFPPASSPEWSVDLGAFTYDVDLHEATLVVGAIALMAGVHLLLQHTKLGTAMRAMADNRDLAKITGIPTERVVFWTWVIGAGLAGVAGFLIVLDTGTLDYNTGWFLLLMIFAAVILGGIGSIYGAILGGLIIGLASNVSLVWLPSDMTQVAAFTLMILILIFRPDGLLGGVRTA